MPVDKSIVYMDVLNYIKFRYTYTLLIPVDFYEY